MTITSKKILTKAIDRLKVAGWCQGKLTNPSSGEVCAIAAINCGFFEYPQMPMCVHVDYDIYNNTVKLVQKVIQEKYGSQYSIHSFNDLKTTKMEDVIEVLQLAITSLPPE